MSRVAKPRVKRLFKYDRDVIRRMLVEKGYGETIRHFPSENVRYIAKEMGISTWQRKLWKDEWDALLGTMGDAALAAKLDVSGPLVAQRRRELGIKARGVIKRVEEYQKKLTALANTDLKYATHDISKKYGIPNTYVQAEKKKRNIDARGSNRGGVQYNMLIRAAIAGIMAAHGDVPGIQAQIARQIGVSRERVRQLVVDIKQQLLSHIEAANES